MMDEAEYELVHAEFAAGIKAVKTYREQHGTSLKDTPMDQIYAPLQQLYRELSQAAGFTAPVVKADHIYKHRLTDYGPPCPHCGRPYRTPNAKLCAECGRKRAP